MYQVQNATLLTLFLFILNGTEVNHDSNIFSGREKAFENKNVLDISRFRNVIIDGYKSPKYYEDIDDNYDIGKFYYNYLIMNNVIFPTDSISPLHNVFIHSHNSSKSIESILSFLNGFLYKYEDYFDETIDIKTAMNGSVFGNSINKFSQSFLILSNIYEKLEQLQNFPEKRPDKVVNLFSEDNQTTSAIISAINLINETIKPINSHFSIEIWKPLFAPLFVRILLNDEIIHEMQFEIFRLSLNSIKLKFKYNEALVYYIYRCEHYSEALDKLIHQAQRVFDLMDNSFDQMDSLQEASENENNQDNYFDLASKFLYIKKYGIELLDHFSDSLNNEIEVINSYVEFNYSDELIDDDIKDEYDKIKNVFLEKINVVNDLIKKCNQYKSMAQSRYDEFVKKIKTKLDSTYILSSNKEQ